MTPSLYLLSRPHFTNEYQAFLAKTGVIWQETKVSDAERVVEFAGRICYMSFGARQSPRDNAAYIANLIDQGHDSVLEHASWTFLLDGVSRSLTHQLIRHRIGFSYSQLSQQYYDHSAAEFLMPTGLEQNPVAFAAWSAAIEAARNAYYTIQSQLGAESGQGRNSRERSRADSICRTQCVAKLNRNKDCRDSQCAIAAALFVLARRNRGGFGDASSLWPHLCDACT